MLDIKLIRLMRDYGYEVRGRELWGLAIGNLYPARFVRHCRSVFDAADQLCSIIADAHYTDDFVRITEPTK